MTIAAQLPTSNLDIRGDRLRFQLANAINECEQQYRNGGNDKSTNTVALLNAAIARLTVLATVGSLTLGAVSGNDNITNTEAGSTVTAPVTTANFGDGAVLSVTLDGAVVAGVTVSNVTSNAATVSLTSAAATALSIGTHSLTLTGTDAAGVARSSVRQFTRTVS